MSISVTRMFERFGRTDATLLAVFFIVSIGLSGFYFTGFYASDDVSYFHYARLFSELGELTTGFGGNRSGMILLASFLLWLDGTGYAQSAIVPLILLHGVVVLLCYAIGRILHGRSTAVIAAAVTSVLPLLYIYAGAMLPDVPLTVLVGTAILCLALLVSKAASGEPLSNARLIGCSLAAGLLVGIAYLIKEYAILFSAVALATIVTTRGRFPFFNGAWAGVAAFLGGLLLVMLGEAILYRIVAGVWINRLNIGLTDDPLLLEHMVELRNRHGVWPWERAVNLYQELSRRVFDLWLVPFGFGLLVYPLLGRLSWPGRSATAFVALGYFWIIAFLLLFPARLSPYLPAAIVDRYYIMAVPLAAVGLGHVLSSAIGFTSRFLPRWVPVIAVSVLIGFFAAERVSDSHRNAGIIYRAWEYQIFDTMYSAAVNSHADLPIAVDETFSTRISRALPPGLVNAGRIFMTYNWETLYDIKIERYYQLLEDKRRFFYLVHADPRLQGETFANLLHRCTRKEISLKRVGASAYNPQSRLTRLKDAFGLPARPLSRNANTRGGYLLLVEPRLADDAEGPVRCAGLSEADAPDDRHELFSLTPGFQIEESRVFWSMPPEPVGYVQNLDDRSYKRAPVSDDALLPEPAKRVVANLSVRGVRGSASVSLRIMGYDETGELVTVEEFPEAQLGEGGTTVLGGVLETDRPVTRTKLRLRIQVEPGSSGQILIDNIEISSSSSNEGKVVDVDEE